MKSAYEAVLANFCYGLYVLTVEAEGWPMAMVVSWVSQVSYDPPLISVVIRKNRYARELIQNKKAFALFIMGQDDLEAMPQFKNKNAQKRLAAMKVTQGITGAPIIDFGLSYIECIVEEEISRGDHALFIARIEAAETIKNGIAATTQDYGKVYLGSS